jgi:hypothetical protein
MPVTYKRAGSDSTAARAKQTTATRRHQPPRLVSASERTVLTTA